MSQSTLDDDDLFGEAASEMRADVEESLEAAYESLPDVEDVWEPEGDNVLGTLNSLKAALDVGDAEEHLRDAKKWFGVGQRADAFDDADDLAEEIETLEGLLEDIEDAHGDVSELTATMPRLKGALESGEE